MSNLQIDIEPFLKTDDPREFLEALRVINPHWQWADTIKTRWDIPCIFRGHKNAKWSLLPSMWRISDPGDLSFTKIETKADEMVAHFIKRGGREAVRKALERLSDHIYGLLTENAAGPEPTEKQARNNLEGLLLQIGAQQEIVREFVVLANKVGHSILFQFGFVPDFPASIETGSEIVDGFTSYRQIEDRFQN